MLFKNESSKQLKQEIITNLAGTVKEMKELSAEIENHFLLEAFITSNPNIPPIWRFTEEFIKLDKLTAKLIHLIEQKKELLHDAQNRKAKIKTGNLKLYIKSRLPERELKYLTNELVKSYRNLYIILNKFYKDDVKNRAIDPKEKTTEYYRIVVLNLISEQVEEGDLSSALKRVQIPPSIDVYRKHFLEIFSVYSEAAKKLEKQDPEMAKFNYEDMEKFIKAPLVTTIFTI